MRLLLSVAVVYRFFPAENKSIFAQRYGPCTPPDGTKHTNVRRTGTKHKTNVKDARYALIPYGFSTLAPLAEMRYTGNTKTNVKEKRDPFRLAASRQATLPLLSLHDIFPRSGGSRPSRGRLCELPESFPPPPKAVPLGKVA